VAVEVDACVPVDRAALEKVVAIELGTSIGGDPVAARRAALTRVQIGCTLAGVAIALDDGVTGKSITRVVDLAGVVPNARTRLLALATAELVVASWIELTLDPPPLAPVGTPASARARTAAARIARERATPAAARAFDLAAGVRGALWTSDPGPIPAVGADLALVHRAFAYTGWLACVGLERGVARVGLPQGDADLTTALDATLAAFFHADAGPFRLAAGAGGSLALAYLQGHPPTGAGYAGRSVRIPVGGPVLVARLAYRFDDRLSVVWHAQGTWFAWPARALADGRTTLAIEGAHLATGFALALAL
jgi:hypothetical protein